MSAILVWGAVACSILPAKDNLAVDAVRWREAVLTRADPHPDLEARDHPTMTPHQLHFARHVNALDTALTGRPLVGGNRVALLIDGPATHDAQIAAIAEARHHVHINVYILAGDSVGHRYLEALGERAAAGVAVRVMYDAYGARGAGSAFLDRFRQAGIELRAYGPLNPADAEAWRLSRRLHRKLLIVDGRVAFTGGINISDQYSVPPGSSTLRAGWRDTHVRIDGPAVAEFQRIFLQSWTAESGTNVGPSDLYFPQLPPAGHDLVRAVLRDGEDLSDALLGPFSQRAQQRERGGHTDHPIYASYLVAMSEARQRIWITQAYFIPNDTLLEALREAARRGVDVRLLLPGYTDVGMMIHAAHYYYGDLLEAGVRVFEYVEPEAVLHAKTAVIDGVWATVGSSNLDYRSFIHNDEANAIVISDGFATAMEHMYLEDLAHAREITAAEWKRRSLWSRVLESLAVTFKYWI